MNTKRLLKLADFLNTLPREKFDFGQIAHEDGKPMLEALKLGATRCGTVACAIGWMPAVWPRELTWRERELAWYGRAIDVTLRNNESVTDFDVAESWFGLTDAQAEVLFTPNKSGFGLRAISERALPKTVARRIRRFVEKNAKKARA